VFKLVLYAIRESRKYRSVIISLEGHT